MKNIALLLLFCLFACKKKQDFINPVVQPITQSVYASGIIKSKNQYKVYSTVVGVVEEVLVAENDVVKMGTPLFRIANESQQLAEKNALLLSNFNNISLNGEKLQAAQEVIDLNKLKMENEELMLTRQQSLWVQEIGSKVDLEQRQLSFESSKTNYLSAVQAYAELRKQLTLLDKQAKNNYRMSNQSAGDFNIKAIVDGKVYQINVSKGEMASPQAPLAIIGDDNSFVLEMEVDEYDIVSIQVGMKIMLSLNSYKGVVYEATVTKINPIMNEYSKSFTIEAKFINAPPALYPNISFEANIIIETKSSALLVPREYLFNDTLVLLKSGEKRVVVTGLKDLQMIEIISGIDVKDELMIPAE